ncbi:MAG: hypothetical protein IPG90_05315 [Bacteroidetes bacterium]|nr:hypothetical protein [Bacteroidota bacterium]
MKKLILFLLLIFNLYAISIAQNPRSLIAGVNTKFKQVNNYEAIVVIKTEIPFIKMLPVSATIYFKQPDKIRIKSKGIAILPKQGIDDLLKTLADTISYSALYQGEELLKNVNVAVVSIIPLADTSDMILGKFWIDPKQSLVMRSQITTRTNGTILSEYVYGKFASFALPDSMTVTVDTKKFKIPKAVSADINNYNSSAKDPAKQSKKGRIILRFSEYKINQGIPDEIFKQK